MKLIQFLLFLVLFLIISIKTDINPITSTQNELYSQRKLETNVEYQEIRIYVDKTCIENQNNYDQNLQTFFDYIISGLNKSVSTFQKLLKVERLTYPINNITRENLTNWGFTDSTQINQDLLIDGAGIEADLVIIPIFIKNDTSSLLSVGEPKILDKTSRIPNRPIVGILKINQNKIWDAKKKNNDHYINSIFLHQFTHILGFTFDMFEYFQGGLNNTVMLGNENRTNITKYFIITERVVSFAKKYFNCPNIRGVELEDTPGNDGLANSHWEARVLLGEYMVSKPYPQEQVISEFTLSLLEDSGWYKAYYFTGGLMRFGKNQGCEFIEEDCMYGDSYGVVKLKTDFKNDFLTGRKQPSCASGRQSRAYVHDYTNPENVYFRFRYYNSHGKDIADYCFVSDFFQVNEDYDGDTDENKEPLNLYDGSCNKEGKEYGYNIKFTKNSKTYDVSKIENINEFGQVINNNNSFCALSNVIPKKNKQDYGDLYLIVFPKCYQMHCTERSLTIEIVEQFVACPRSGGIVSVDGNFEGYLYCPDYNLICSGTVMCNDMFDCVEKESLSKNNTYDYDYTIETSQEIVDEPDLKVGYEETIDGKCPQYCSQCKEKKKCFVCKNNTYVLIGHRENDEKPIICDETVGENYYYNKNDGVYYLCMDGCKNCTQGDKCNECYVTHYLNDTTAQCEEKIPHCIRSDDNYENCKECEKPYYLINNDTKNCYKDKNLSEYFTEDNGTTYIECNIVMEECVECNNRSICEKCSPTYKLNEDHSACLPKVNNCLIYDDNNEECEKCVEGYYLINYDNSTCYNDKNLSKYYPEGNKTRYILCNLSIPNCEECDEKNECKICYPEYKLNDEKKCEEKVENCKKYDDNFVECLECKEPYYLLYPDRQHCKNDSNTTGYYTDDNKTYYPCNYSMEGCEECESKDHCTKCYPSYYLSNDSKSCSEIVEHCKRYDENYTNCLECEKPYVLIDDDRKHCHKDIDEERYFPIDENNNTYNSCNKTIQHCQKCDNEKKCNECDKKYVLSEDSSLCIKQFDPEEDCEISIQYINEEDLSILSDVNIAKLVKKYLNNNAKNFGKVQHYINLKYNFTITIFKTSECTQHLISKGYFSIYTKEVLSSYNYEYYIRCFITYQYNNYINFYETSKGDPIPSDPNKNFEITNNFTNSMSDLIGNSLRKKVSNQNINLFDKQNEIFNDKCQNFTIYGIDVPLKIRLSTLYLGDNEVAYICTDNNCVVKEKSMVDYISNCECKINTDFDHLTNNKINQMKNIWDYSSSNFGESFELFSCIGDGFKKEIITINYGFYICAVCLVIQIIFFISYLIPKKKENNIKSSNIKAHSNEEELKEDNKEKEVIYNEHNIKSSINNNNNDNYNIIDNNPSDHNTCNGDDNNDNNNVILTSNPPPKLLFYSKWYGKKNNSLINDSSDGENDMQSRDECPNDNVRRKNRQPVKKPIEDEDSEEEEEKEEEKEEEEKEEEKEEEREEGKEEEDKKTGDIISEENNVVISGVNNIPKLVLKSVNKIEEEESKKKELKPVMTKEEIMKKKRVRSIKNYNEMQKMNFTNIININKKEEEKEEEKVKEEEKEEEKEVEKEEEKKEEAKIDVKESIQSSSKTEEKLSEKTEEPPEPPKPKEVDNRTFCDFYFETLSIKQHIINLFSDCECCNKAHSYIPFQMKIIRFIFMIIMNIFFNSLFLKEDYFVDKYDYFNKKYDFSSSTTLDNISTGEQITYGLKNCFPTFLISLIICLVIQFIIGIIFYGNKKSVEEVMENENVKNKDKEIEIVALRMKIKYIIFGIISFLLMVCATLFILGFQAVYAGGFADYIACFLFTFIILQIIPFIISVIIAAMWCKGVKSENKCLIKFSRIFLF